jgi:hypothetical protein
MLYRNLRAMETEEALRSLPVDGAVLMGGYGFGGDLPTGRSHAARKLEWQSTGPAVPVGGSSGQSAAPEPSPTRIGTKIENGIALAEALGMTLPGAAAIPAPDSNHREDARREPGVGANQQRRSDSATAKPLAASGGTPVPFGSLASPSSHRGAASPVFPPSRRYPRSFHFYSAGWVFPKGSSLHSLRHSDGSHPVADGVRLPVVSERLGHSSMPTLCRARTTKRPNVGMNFQRRGAGDRDVGY